MQIRARGQLNMKGKGGNNIYLCELKIVQNYKIRQ